MATPSIVQTLQSGEQSGNTSPKLSTELLNELLAADEAKKNGDTLGQTAALLRSEMAARKESLAQQGKALDERIKSEEEIQELKKELRQSTDANKRVSEFLDAVNEGDWNTADAIASTLEGTIVESLYQKIMDYRAIRESDNEQTNLSAHLGVDPKVQEGIYADENQEKHDALTTEQVDRRKRITGQELTAEERARVQNRSSREQNAQTRSNASNPAEAYSRYMRGENPFAEDQRMVSPQDAFERDTTKETKPTPTPPETTEQEIKAKVDAINALPRPASMDEAQWIEQKNQWIAEIAGGDTVQKSLQKEKETDTTEFERIQAKIKNYPMYLGEGEERRINPHRAALKFTNSLTKDKRYATVDEIDDMFAQRPFDEIPDEEKRQIARSLASMSATSGSMGGEMVQRFLLSQKLLAAGMPGLRNAWEEIKDSTGVWEKTVEGFMKFVGTTTNRKVAAFQKRLEKITNDVIRLQSGAQINTEEMKRFLSLLPELRNEQTVNEEIFNALEESIKSIFGLLYTDALGNEWGTIAAEEAYNNPKNIYRLLAGSDTQGTQGTQSTTTTGTQGTTPTRRKWAEYSEEEKQTISTKIYNDPTTQENPDNISAQEVFLMALERLEAIPLEERMKWWNWAKENAGE